MLFAPEFLDKARLSGENSPDGRQASDWPLASHTLKPPAIF